MSRDLQTAMDFLDCGPESAGPLERLLAAAREEGRAEGERADRERCAQWIDCGGLKVCKRTVLKDGSCIDELDGTCMRALANEIRAMPTRKDEP